MSSRKPSSDIKRQHLATEEMPGRQDYGNVGGGLHDEVAEWRRKTRNIGAPTRNINKLGVERFVPTHQPSTPKEQTSRFRQSVFSPKTLTRGDSNIKINLNFEGRAYDLQYDVDELRRQLRLKDKENEMLHSELQDCRTGLERRVQVLMRSDCNQREHISQLQLVIRELKSRLIDRNRSPYYPKSKVDPHMDYCPTEPAKKSEIASMLTSDRSTSRLIKGSKVTNEQEPQRDSYRHSQVRTASIIFQDPSQLKLKSQIKSTVDQATQAIDDELILLKNISIDLEKQVSELHIKLSNQTRELEEQCERLQHAEKNNVKIVELKQDIQKFAESLVQKQLQNEKLSITVQEMKIENETMRQLIDEQEKKLKAINGENQNLRNEMQNIENSYDMLQQQLQQLRPIQEENCKLKSNNLELVVQSANEIEAMKKLTEMAQTVLNVLGNRHEATMRVEQGSHDISGIKSFPSSPVKSCFQKSQDEQIRVEQSFVMGSLKNHHVYLQIAQDLENIMKAVFNGVVQIYDQRQKNRNEQINVEKQIEDLKQEIEELNLQLSRESSLTNELLLQTKQKSRIIEVLKEKLEEPKENDEEVLRHFPIKRHLQRFKTLQYQTNYADNLTSIEEKPEEELSSGGQPSPPIQITTAVLSQEKDLKDKRLPSIQSDQGSSKSICQKQNYEPRHAVHETLEVPSSKGKEGRLSIRFQTKDKICQYEHPYQQSERQPSVAVLSRNNLKTMSIKELSYTFLSEFCDKNDQRAEFSALAQKLVGNYFSVDSTIGKAFLEFLSHLQSFPNHVLLFEKAQVYLQELLDYSRGAQREVAALDEAVEEYLQNMKETMYLNPIEDSEEEDESSNSKSRSDVNISLHDRTIVRKSNIDTEQKGGDMSSVTDLLEKGLQQNIQKLKRRSTVSRTSVISSLGAKLSADPSQKEL